MLAIWMVRWYDLDGTPDLGLQVRLLRFPVPTICVANGHWCAAGGMLGLTFDFRVMSNDRGFFFIPGVDLGLQSVVTARGLVAIFRVRASTQPPTDARCAFPGPRP